MVAFPTFPPMVDRENAELFKVNSLNSIHAYLVSFCIQFQLRILILKFLFHIIVKYYSHLFQTQWNRIPSWSVPLFPFPVSPSKPTASFCTEARETWWKPFQSPCCRWSIWQWDPDEETSCWLWIQCCPRIRCSTGRNRLGSGTEK